MEKIQKKTKEEWGDYLKLKKLNEGRMEKVLAPAYDPLKCPCNRPTKSVFCVGCGYFGKGRKYVPCNKHSQVCHVSLEISYLVVECKQKKMPHLSCFEINDTPGRLKK